MDSIQIFDNFLQPHMHEQCLKELEKPKWKFLSGSYQIWHMGSLNQVPFFNITMRKKVLEIMPAGTNWVDYDIYANGQTRGQDGSLHQDQQHLSNALSFLYYATPGWIPDYEGDISFYDSDPCNRSYELIKTVQYKPNRGVLFPGNIHHKASAPSLVYNGLRTSVVYKMIDGDDKETAEFVTGLETK